MDRHHRPRLCLFALILIGLCACDPMTPYDRDFFKKLDEERAAREGRMRSARSNFTEQQLIDRVRQSPASEGEGTTDQWLERQLGAYKGQIMFPKWSSVRRGSNKQDVVFSFVSIDENNNTRRLQYSWTIDVLEMIVDRPVLSQEDGQSSPDRALVDQQERRVREHEKALE